MATSKALPFYWGAIALFVSAIAVAHGVGQADQQFLTSNDGPQIATFVYLGAKHMVTGYDHLLFLVGVIFFLYRLKEVALYVSLFALGHSITLLFGVLSDVRVNPYIVDTIIGLSVAYKAFDNLDGFKTLFGFEPEPRSAVLIFGFCHGFGLATKLQEISLSKEGLVTNMISFNVGVELGQFLALALILVGMNIWRRTTRFYATANVANVVLMCAGFMLAEYQMIGYWRS